MAKYREVFKTEKYMDDVSDSIMSNLVNGLKRRKQLSIWEPLENPIETVSFDSDLSERNKILSKILRNNHDSFLAQSTKRSREEKEFASGTAVKRNGLTNGRPPKSFYSTEPRSNQNIKNETKMGNSKPEEYSLDIQYSQAIDRASESSHQKEQINCGNKQDYTLNNNSMTTSNLDFQNSGSKVLERTLSSRPQKEQGNPLNEENDELLLNNSISNTNIDAQSMESETFDVVSSRTDQRSDFAAWCKRRQEQSNVSKNQSLPHETKTVSFKPKMMKERKINSAPPAVKTKIIDHAKKHSKSKSEIDISDIQNKMPDHHAIKHSKSKSEIDISDIENKMTDHAIKRSKSKSEVIDNKKLNHVKQCMKSRSEDNLAKTQVCIKLANENCDKSKEFFVDVSDISRIKKRFPKLNDIFPDLDSESTTVPCCLEAVTIILRYLFNGRSTLNDLPNATIAVEALAASKIWEIENFYSIFFDIFVQKILPSSNIKFIFSQASHYNLHEVCKACQEINDKNASLNSVYRGKQKKCSLSITTYIEPFELCIPLCTTVHNNFELSFERHIVNTIRFQALSGFFTIVGIHINLNSDHLETSNNSSMLFIDYNAKNVTQELELGTGRCEKPLRPINVIYFKNPLDVNPNQLIEITVETDLKPFLCSTYPMEIQIRKKKKGGEFRLNVVSNFKIPTSNENLYIVGKLLYCVKNQPKF